MRRRQFITLLLSSFSLATGSVWGWSRQDRIRDGWILNPEDK